MPLIIYQFQLIINQVTNSFFLNKYKQVTYIDFVMYELFDIHSKLVPGLLDDFLNLKAYHMRIQGNERISAYIKSDKFIRRLNGAMAPFNWK